MVTVTNGAAMIPAIWSEWLASLGWTESGGTYALDFDPGTSEVQPAEAASDDKKHDDASRGAAQVPDLSDLPAGGDWPIVDH
jgi:hypothetical protein